MNAVVSQVPAQNAPDLKSARSLQDGAQENLLGATNRSSNRPMPAPSQTAWLEMLANTEAGYAAVVEGVEEFLYREELHAADHSR